VAGWSPFALQLGAVAGFPSPRRPRLIACEIGPAERLSQLAQAVEGAVGQAGCEPETRPFRAHLTLGRISERLREPVTAAVTAVNESWLVEEIVLFRSRLTSSGAIHTPLERIALGGSDHP
jgi:2'-5' RNA ligase